jgi:hypothetical protein
MVTAGKGVLNPSVAGTFLALLLGFAVETRVGFLLRDETMDGNGLGSGRVD